MIGQNPAPALRLTHIGGPTVLIEIGALRLLTDPTFDAADQWYGSAPVALHKVTDPARPIAAIGSIDAVLLSHDQHADNLDQSGRAFLPQAGQVLTTPDGAGRLGGNARGVATWETIELASDTGERLRVTATPARHGPPGIEPISGAVTGWIVAWEGQRRGALYISGDTVLYEGMEEIARRFRIGTALLHFGAARLAARGPDPLTLTGEEGARFAAQAGIGMVIPIHYEGWGHFSEGRDAIAAAFAQAQIEQRLCWLPLGQPVALLP